MNEERNKGDLEVNSTLTTSQLTNLSLRCDILNTKLFFEYFSPRYKICHLVYFNSLIPFINSYPTPIHYLFYSQRDFFFKKHQPDHSTAGFEILHGFPSSPLHVVILWPRILFPLPSAGYFHLELTCHLFREAFSDTPRPTPMKSFLLAPFGSTSLTVTLATFPAVSGQGPCLLYSWLHPKECLEHSRFSTGIFKISEQINEATEDEAGRGSKSQVRTIHLH